MSTLGRFARLCHLTAAWVLLLAASPARAAPASRTESDLAAAAGKK